MSQEEDIFNTLEHQKPTLIKDITNLLIQEFSNKCHTCVNCYNKDSRCIMCESYYTLDEYSAKTIAKNIFSLICNR